MNKFVDKNVIVTGAGEGIGLGICRAFAEAGAFVALNDIRADVAHRMAAHINHDYNEGQAAARVYAYPGDVAEPDVVYQIVDGFTAQVGAPDMVIANAGITRYIEFLHSTPEMFDRIVQVNLRGSYFLAQAAAKQMIAAGKKGRIVLMSSVVGLRAFPNFSIYGMTKAGIQMLAKSMALELGPYGITVNAISPGATLTPRTEREDPNYAANWATVNLTKRVGEIDDVVAAVLFLASESAGQITGQNLIVDGGWTLRSPIPEDAPEKPVG